MMAGSRSLAHDVFEDTMRDAGLADWVEAHKDTSGSIAFDWSIPIDLLLLDGDQPAAGAKAAFGTCGPPGSSPTVVRSAIPKASDISNIMDNPALSAL